MRIKYLKVGPLETNCYFLISRKEMVIIDPGDESLKIIEELKKTEASLKFIINTHYHPDHVSANQEIKNKTGSKILIHEAEKEFIDFRADIYLKDNDKIKIGDIILKIILTPGHTKGSICLLGDNFIFTGDTLFKEGYGRTDFDGGSQKEMKKSLIKLSKLIKPGMTVYPGHDEIFNFDNNINFI
jgi:hydroxyacylglutathione hydrolase